MKRAFHFISGIFMGLGPVVGLGVLGVVIYAGFPTIIGGIVATLLPLAGIWIGVSIFKKVQIVGPFELMSATHASPDLDNLIPTAGSETKLISTPEYVDSINRKMNLFHGGSMRIFGDWFGEAYQNNHQIIGADYNSTLDELTIRFSEGEVLQILRPRNIFEASTFMKILDAQSVRLEFLHSIEKRKTASKYYLMYSKTNSKIEAQTNVDWYKPWFDTSLGEPAIVIYGRFDGRKTT